MTAVRLQHASVQIPRDALDACTTFYASVLGMRGIPNLAGMAWFEFGDGDHVHLLAGEAAATSIAHFAIEVDDLADTLDRCTAMGLEPRKSDNLWGAERWFVRDPAGNLVELFDTSPPPTPSE